MTTSRRAALPLAAAVAVVVAGGVLWAIGPSAVPSASALPGPAPSAVAVIGDFGSRTAAERDVADLVRSLAPQAIVTTGDNLYSTSTYSEAVGAYYCAWIAGAPDTVGCPRSSMARSNAFFPATGNHDYSDGGIGRYLEYFTALQGRTTYAVTRGGIEFLVVDSTAALESPASMARQRAWTRARARTSTATWQVVVLHHAPFSSSSAHGSTRAFQWPFSSWGVDLVLAGHDHDYERLRRGGVTYVVDGAGGAELYDFAAPVAGSVVRVDDEHGVLLLVEGRTGLEGTFWTTSGQRRDRFVLPR